MGMAPAFAGGLGLLGPDFVPGRTAARGRSRRLVSLMAGRVPASSAAGRAHFARPTPWVVPWVLPHGARAQPAVSVAVTEKTPQIRSSQ
jgi:hypothetical protein